MFGFHLTGIKAGTKGMRSGCSGPAASCPRRRSALTFPCVLKSCRTSVRGRRRSVSGRHVVLEMQLSDALRWGFQSG